MDQLVGKTVTGLLVNEDQSILVFETDCGPVAYETEGDCCSETWFADITGVPALLDQRVIAVHTMDLPEPQDSRSRQEFDRAYGAKLHTGKGIVDIVYRNSSNGYYGGGIRPHDGPLRGTFTRIVADWQA